MNLLSKKYDNISDFEELIKCKVQKSNNIDFFDSSKISTKVSFENKLIATICGIANTIGGILFLGIKSQRKKATAISFIKDNNFTKKYLSHLISLNIKPYPDNIEIIEFTAQEGKLFAIKINKSTKAPFLSNDYRYYTRYAEKTVLMEENQIRNLFTLNSKPELDFVGLINTSGVPTLNDGKIVRINFYPKFLIKNTGSHIERFYKIEIGIPTELHDVNFSVLHDYFSRYEDNRTIFSIKAKSPIFQNEIYTIAEAKLVVNSENYHIFENSSIYIKLFYSQGTKQSIIDLKNTFLYNKKIIEPEHFAGIIANKNI